MKNYDAQRLPDRSFIATEQRNPLTSRLHALTVAECVDVIIDEDKQVFSAVDGAKEALTRFILAAKEKFLAGGRLIYLGAGTSGRLGVLDASEMLPTFNVLPNRVIGMIAGGDDALRWPQEGAEDDVNGAYRDIESLNLSNKDIVLGITASGSTLYVIKGIAYAKERHPDILTGLLTCAPVEACDNIDHIINLTTGPEVIAGSTRMKAGTATKLALNVVSTTLMIHSGLIYRNLMVDLKVTNKKLFDRAVRIVMTLTNLSRQRSFDLLHDAGGCLKTAIVMHRQGLSCRQAYSLLLSNDHNLGKVLEDGNNSCGGSEYYIVIEGGATKTSVYVLDDQERIFKEFILGPSNIHSVDKSTVRLMFAQIFSDHAFADIVSDMRLFAGLSGLNSDDEKVFYQSMFQRLGFVPSNINLMSDIELMVQLLGGDDGVVLIAGTGSSCIGIKGDDIVKAGGMGHILGDEGSGYAIGIQALKAALAAEEGYGETTSMLKGLCQHFTVNKLKDLIFGINRGFIKKHDVATIAPIVFEAAHHGDKCAQGIIHQAAMDLAALLARVLAKVDRKQCRVFLVGGIFCCQHAAAFVREMQWSSVLKPLIDRYHPVFKNVATKKPALLAVKNLLSRREVR